MSGDMYIFGGPQEPPDVAAKWDAIQMRAGLARQASVDHNAQSDLMLGEDGDPLPNGDKARAGIHGDSSAPQGPAATPR